MERAAIKESIMLNRLTLLAIYCVISALIAGTVEHRAFAQRDTSATTELLLDGDNIVTTATRTAQKLGDSPAAVTVITAEDIKASGATTIPELLSSVPGVDVMQPNQSQQNVAIRGFNNVFSNTVLVMVDGRRINEDFRDSVFWVTDPILLSRIKKIEIVRGPGSVLYGADAFSGVINIILKTPMEMAAESKQGTFVGQYENHSTTFAEGSYTFADKNQDLAATVGVGFHGIVGPYKNQPGQVQDSSSVPIYTLDIQKLTQRGSFILSAAQSDARTDLTSDVVLHDAHFHTNSFSLAYTEDRSANPITARLYRNFLRLSGPSDQSSGSATELDLQQERVLSSKNTINYGLAYKFNDARSSTTGPDRYSEHVNSIFLQDQDQIGPKTTLFAGVRDDDHSLYGTQISSRLSLVDHVTSKGSFRLSYGTAFSAPTYSENFLDFTSPIGGGLNVDYVSNTGLKPEKISSTEAGYRIEFPKGYAGINLFYNNISDIIEPAFLEFAPSPYPPGIPIKIDFQNQGTSTASGFELEGGFPVGSGWKGIANYSYQNVRDQSGSVLDYSPANKVNLVLQSDNRRRCTVYFAGHYVGRSTSDGFALRAYTTVDARVGYRLGKSQDAWTAALASVNLLDDHHEEYVDNAGTAPGMQTAEPAMRTIRVELDGKF
jgi:outer membrane cobalamin receptor